MPPEPDRASFESSTLTLLLRVLVPGFFCAAVILFYHPGAMDMDRLKWSLVLAVGLLLLAVSLRAGLITTAFGSLSPALVMAALIPVFLLFSCFRTGAPSFEEARLMIGLIVLIIVAAVVRDGVWARPRVIPGIILLSGSIAALLGVIQSTGTEFLYHSNEGAEAVSTLGNTNAAAEVFALLLPLAAAGLFAAGWTTLLFAAPCVAFLTAGLTATGGRGGLIAALCGLAAFLFALMRANHFGRDLKPRRFIEGHRKSLVWLVLLLAVGSGSAFLVRQTPNAPFKNIDSDASVFSASYPTNKIRLSLWKGTTHMIGAHPIMGTGPGRFRYEYAAYRDPEEARIRGRLGAVTEVENPHNEFLWAAAEGGICTAAALGLFVFLLLRQGAVASRTAQKPWHALYGASLFGTVVAFGVLCLVRSPLHNPAAATILFIAAGMLDATRYEAGTGRPSPLSRIIVGSVGVIAIGIFSFIGTKALVSDLIFAGVGAATRTTPTEVEALDRAISIDDGNIELINFRGQIAARIAQETTRNRDEHEADAVRFLSDVLERHPSHPGALRSMAQIKLLQDDRIAGIRMLRRAFRLIGSDEDPVQAAARYLEEQKLPRRAALLFVDFFSGREAEFLERTAAMLDSGLAREAALYADALLEKNPLHVDALHLKARCLRELSRASAAEGAPGDGAASEVFSLMQAAISLEYLEKGEWTEAANAAARAARYSEDRNDQTAQVLEAIAEAALGNPFDLQDAPIRSTAMRTRLKALAQDNRLPKPVRAYLRTLEP